MQCELILLPQDFVYPENIALPIGGPGTARYLVIEMHYNNPDTVSGKYNPVQSASI